MRSRLFRRSLRRLRYPAPFQESEELPGGRWAHTPWTLQGVKDIIKARGWFSATRHGDGELALSGRYSFADPEAKQLAMTVMRVAGQPEEKEAP